MSDPSVDSTANPLRELAALGQSVWLDFIRRSLISSGELARLVEEDGVRGMTSNPAIFEKAIAAGDEYSDQIAAASAACGGDARRLYEELAISDIRDAADVLAPVYEASGGEDGFVSLEVAPDLADATAATIDEARRLWGRVARPNLMIKVPGTAAGLPAIETLLSEGINVNVTLLFARETYARVAEAYLRALEARVRAGEPVDRIASVASFFVSRIDTLVDHKLDSLSGATGEKPRPDRLVALRGKVAIANAKLAYVHFRELSGSPRWRELADRGARPQRLLWASTSTKDPAYRDTLYVEELIGPQTVNTIPPETLEAFRDHGVAESTLERGVDEAVATLDALAAAGIDLEKVTDQLLTEGVEKFVRPFESLLATIAERSRELSGQPR